MSDKPLGQRNYEQFAERYAKYAGDKPHNAHYERPATFSLLPDVRGQRVLDAGCGPGLYTRELLERGARVVAFDVTPQMIALTRERVGNDATLHVHDLARPLKFAANQEFDTIVCPLVLDYLDDWEPVFAEFFRVLRPGGTLVYSHSHPMSDYLLVKQKIDANAQYFACEQFAMHWAGFGHPQPRVEGYCRPLEQMLAPLTRCGFALERLLEPRPTEPMRRANPELYAKLSGEPCFICLRARRPTA